MTDTEIIQLCPLCVNVARLGAYLLAPDEVIFFDWLVTKTAVVFNFKPFYYSAERIEIETRIKRRSLERIIKRFCAFGFLSIEVKGKAGSGGNNRTFALDLSAVCDRLPEIIDQQHEHAKALSVYFAALARTQKKKQKNGYKETTEEARKREAAEAIYYDLCDTWRERIEMYNAGELGAQNGQKPERAKSVTRLPRSGVINKALARLSETYDHKTVRCAFIAFADSVLIGELSNREITDVLSYFLKYDEERQQYGVMNAFLGVFQNSYSYKND